MIGRITLAAFAVCLAACASSGPERRALTAEEQAAADQYAEELLNAKVESGEVICRKEQATGSRMSKRVCRKRAEIEERAELDQEALRRGTNGR